MIVGLENYAHEAGHCYRTAYGHHAAPQWCGDPRCEAAHEALRAAAPLLLDVVIERAFYFLGGRPFCRECDRNHNDGHGIGRDNDGTARPCMVGAALAAAGVK